MTMNNTTSNPYLSELIKQFLGSSPEAAFNYTFAPQLAKQSPFGNWLQGRQSDYFGQYLGKVANDPSLSYVDFLGGVNPQQEFAALAPRQRGENPGQYSPKLAFKNLFGY